MQIAKIAPARLIYACKELTALDLQSILVFRCVCGEKLFFKDNALILCRSCNRKYYCKIRNNMAFIIKIRK